MKTWEIENATNMKIVEKTLHREENQVKIKLSKIAISSTDVNYFMQNIGNQIIKVPGHSAIGYVSEAEESSGLKMGARVVVSPFVAKEIFGSKRVLTMGVDTDGLLSDFCCLPTENVYVLPDGISDNDAIFAEYIAMALKVFTEIECEKGDYIVVVGASTLGLIVAQLAVYYQMVPILVDFDADKLKLAENWGVYYTLNTTLDNLERRVEEITAGRKSEYVIYVGDGISLNNAVRLVKDGGEVVISGYASAIKHEIDAEILLRKNLTVKGISNGYGEMSSAINILANEIIKTEGIINKSVNFEELQPVFEECEKYPYKYNKILVEFD